MAVPRLGFSIKLAGGIEQGDDVISAIEPCTTGLTHGQAPTAAMRRVLRGQPILDGQLEDRSERQQCLVDRVCGQGSFAELGLAVTVDVHDCDLIESGRSEEAQQMPETPLQAGVAGGRQAGPAPSSLDLLAREPVLREVGQLRWTGPRSVSPVLARRLPNPPANPEHQQSHLPYCLLARFRFECQIASLSFVAKARTPGRDLSRDTRAVLAQLPCRTPHQQVIVIPSSGGRHPLDDGARAAAYRGDRRTARHSSAEGTSQGRAGSGRRP